jgi:radical SAM protein with 4Fe4S-binding SPASM domain
MDYVLDELGIHLLHMPINVLGRSNRHDPLAIRTEDFDIVNSYYSAAVCRSIRDVVNKPVDRLCLLSAVVEMVDTLIHPSEHQAIFICPAGNGTIAVDSDGTVYPCFMFYRNSKFRLGSVSRRGAQVLEDGPQKSFVEGLRPEAIPNLARSWAWRFLQGCAGGNYFKNEDHGVVAEDEVQFVEAMVSAAVVELAHLKSDDLQWKYLPMALNLFKLYVDAPSE